MAQAVIDLLRDRERAERLGRRAAQDMIERYSWDRLAVDVEQIYGAGT
jgi:glycosyltransferase involved in cell wall biosynthesis